MRKLVFILSTLISLFTFGAEELDFPEAILNNFKVLGIKPTLDQSLIDKAQMRSKHSVITKGNVIFLSAIEYDPELLIDRSYDELTSYIKKLRLIPLEKKHYFIPYTNQWVNETSPEHAGDYFEVVFKALDEKLKEMFRIKNITLEEEFSIERPRIHPKLLLDNHYYVDYHRLRSTLLDLGPLSLSIQQIDALREVIIFQISAGHAFDERWVNSFLSFKSDISARVFEMILIAMMEKRGQVEKRFFEKLDPNIAEAQFFEIFNWIERFDDKEKLEGSEVLFNSLQLKRAIFFFDKFEKYILNYLYFQIKSQVFRSPVGLEKIAQDAINELSVTLSTSKDSRIEKIFLGLFLPHLEKIKTENDLELFQGILWSSFSQFKIESLDILEDEEYDDFLKFLGTTERKLNRLKNCKESLFNILL